MSYSKMKILSVAKASFFKTERKLSKCKLFDSAKTHLFPSTLVAPCFEVKSVKPDVQLPCRHVKHTVCELHALLITAALGDTFPKSPFFTN